MAHAPFPIQPELTAVAIGYRNANLIADQVLPRVPVSKQEFKYLKHTLAESFTIPDTKVGRTSRPTEINFSATEVVDYCVGYGLEDAIPQADLDNAPPNYNPMMRATEGLTDLLALDREQRVANLVFSTSSYTATTNRTQLSGTSQWSDYTNSNPITAMLTALDGCVMRPNILILGQAVWSALRQHPKLATAIYGPSGSGGIITREQLANALEIEAVLIGQGWVNSAKKGQTASLGRLWGKHAAFIYRDSFASASRGTSFGFTAQWGSKEAGSRLDPDIGLKGGARIRVGEYLKELVTATDLGFFFQDAVA